jgi:hypothetical protein
MKAAVDWEKGAGTHKIWPFQSRLNPPSYPLCFSALFGGWVEPSLTWRNDLCIVCLCQSNKSPRKFQLISKPWANERIKPKEKCSKLSERHKHVRTIPISNIWDCLYNFPRICLLETHRDKMRETRTRICHRVRMQLHSWLLRMLNNPPSFEEGS